MLNDTCDLWRGISKEQVSREGDLDDNLLVLNLTEGANDPRKWFLSSLSHCQTPWMGETGSAEKTNLSLLMGMLWSNLLFKPSAVMQCYILKWSDTPSGHRKVQCCFGMGPIFRFTEILLSRVLREICQIVTISEFWMMWKGEADGHKNPISIAYRVTSFRAIARWSH